MSQKFYFVYFDQDQIDIFATCEEAVECVGNIQQDARALYKDTYADNRFHIIERLMEVETA